ncbi:hypothetical protein L218DRAFT_948363 [Marasmius fiardii PR-910]|nr:hypothetical protein L218DRAFT_948363 [Marasmius fiardii PR-910]
MNIEPPIFHLHPSNEFDITIFSFDAHKAIVAAKLSMHACLLYTVFKASALVIFTLFHIIFTLRVYALHDKSLRLAYLFGFMTGLSQDLRTYFVQVYAPFCLLKLGY